MLSIVKPLCRHLNVELNKWPSVIKLVQGAMNRQSKASRANMSPIELTTGIKPKSASARMLHVGGTLDILSPQASLTLNESARKLARRMEEIYDMANLARRAKSEQNRARTNPGVIPALDTGIFVLYAKHKSDTKLDYTWLGPAVITKMVSPLVYTIRPYTTFESVEFDIHISRLRRFAGSQLRMTE